MKPTKKSHIEFCQAVANGHSYKSSYAIIVGGLGDNICKGTTKKVPSDKTCEQNGSKLAAKYADYIQELKEVTAKAIDKAHENDAVNDVLGAVLTKAERMSILSDIIRGDIKVKKAIMTNQRTDYVEVEPDHMDRIKAIAELNKMDGSHAPTKIAPTNKDGEDLEQRLSETDVDKILEKIDAIKNEVRTDTGE